MNLRKLIWWNRQPSLWSHSCPVVSIDPSDDESNVYKISPLSIEALNMDFDGDTSAAYVNHDEEALKEMFKNAYLQNVVHYDSNDSFLSVIRHDALYAAFIITQYSENFDNSKTIYEINSLNELPESIDLFNTGLDKQVKYKNKYYSYGVCLINKWCNFNEIIIDYTITKNQIQLISKEIYDYFEHNTKLFYDNLHELTKKLMFFISVIYQSPSLNIYEMIDLVDEDLQEMIYKIPSGNAAISYYINEALIEKAISNFSNESSLYKLFRSGSRFSKGQLARSCINIGLVADENNIIDQSPINTSLISGLTEEEFFRGSFGTRKGLVDKADVTPQSGYLERTLVMALGVIEITEEDCGTKDGINIIVIDGQHAKSLIGKYYKFKQEDDWLLLSDIKIAHELIGDEIILRSPMKCHTPNFRVCKKCFGEKKTRSLYVGVVAAQCMTERLTQLIMRVFHTSGAANLEKNNVLVEHLRDNLKNIKETDENIFLEFNTTKFPEDYFKIQGFYKNIKNILIYKKLEEEVKNDDAVTIVHKVKEILKKNNKVTKSPDEYYMELTDCILSVGNTYSSYIEMVLAHLFMINKTEFWRYNYTKKVAYKLSDKTLSNKISPLLGFLYQPNKKTIDGADESLLELLEKNENLTIHERIFLQKYKTLGGINVNDEQCK